MIRILLFDDNADLLDLTRQVVSVDGHDCTICETGMAGLTVVDGIDPDIIFLDIGMPRVDGYEVLRELRRRRTRAFLVAFTPRATPEDRDRALAAGFDYYLSKPATFDQIRAVVDLAVGVLSERRQVDV